MTFFLKHKTSRQGQGLSRGRKVFFGVRKKKGFKRVLNLIFQSMAFFFKNCVFKIWWWRRTMRLARTFANAPTYVPTYLPAYLPTYLPTYLPAYLPTYLPTLNTCLIMYRIKVHFVKEVTIGRVVMRGDWSSICRGFRSQHWILDGHFSHYIVVKIVLFDRKDQK